MLTVLCPLQSEQTLEPAWLGLGGQMGLGPVMGTVW